MPNPVQWHFQGTWHAILLFLDLPKFALGFIKHDRPLTRLTENRRSTHIFADISLFTLAVVSYFDGIGDFAWKDKSSKLITWERKTVCHAQPGQPIRLCFLWQLKIYWRGQADYWRIHWRAKNIGMKAVFHSKLIRVLSVASPTKYQAKIQQLLWNMKSVHFHVCQEPNNSLFKLLSYLASRWF